MKKLIVIAIFIFAGCATLGSYAAGKRYAAGDMIPGCFNEELRVTETPPDEMGSWWVECKGTVWKCRGRGLGNAPRCIIDDPANFR